ncbi:acyl-CoA dehydrogenase C-terminal domain-containing protein [Burkholderia contaminans]|nr:acyl-CoA dehydrogenase C-terminal domain-containing protein [Burkholderia contaminans]
MDLLNRSGDVQGARWHDGEVTPADVSCGWLSARMAEAAVSQLAAGSGDAGFLNAKRDTARHSATHVLVQTPVLRDIGIHGAISTLVLSDDQL